MAQDVDGAGGAMLIVGLVGMNEEGAGAPWKNLNKSYSVFAREIFLNIPTTTIYHWQDPRSEIIKF